MACTKRHFNFIGCHYAGCLGAKPVRTSSWACWQTTVKPMKATQGHCNRREQKTVSLVNPQPMPHSPVSLVNSLRLLQTPPGVTAMNSIILVIDFSRSWVTPNPIPSQISTISTHHYAYTYNTSGDECKNTSVAR